MPPSSQRRAIAEIEEDYLEYEALTRSGRRIGAAAAPSVEISEDEEYEELVVAAVPEARTGEHSVSEPRAQQMQQQQTALQPQTAPRLLASFSSLEEDFFAAGEALSKLPDAAADDFADLEAPAARRAVRPSIWRRVLG
jgi:hypothetical protein